MSYDNYDPEKEEQKREQEEAEARKAHAAFLLDVKDTIQTPGGKKLLLHILELANVNGNNYTGDQHTTYLLGRASVGLDILSLMESIDPTLYPRMLLEKAKELTDGPEQPESNT